MRARFYAPSQGRFLSKDSWQGDVTRPLSLNGWNYVEGNPVNRVDPTGKFICLPGCCGEWVNSALVQLTVYGGPFSHFVVDMFDFMDRIFPVFIIFRGEIGSALIPYVITLPYGYLSANLPPPVEQIALFSHEIVHQTQTTDRYTTWGEAQAYIHSGKIIEELGDVLRRNSVEWSVISLAYDINSPGLTTRNLHTLCQVREELVSAIPENPVYHFEPNRLNYLIFPIWYTYCEP